MNLENDDFTRQRQLLRAIVALLGTDHVLRLRLLQISTILKDIEAAPQWPHKHALLRLLHFVYQLGPQRVIDEIDRELR